MNHQFLTSSNLCRLIAGMMLSFVCIACCGCGGGSSTIGNNTSGLRGVAMMASSGANGLIEQGPFPNAIVTIRRQVPRPSGSLAPILFGEVIAQTQADAQGNYSFTIAPGAYGIAGVNPEPNGYGSLAPIPVTVSASQFAQVNVDFVKPVL